MKKSTPWINRIFLVLFINLYWVAFAQNNPTFNNDPKPSGKKWVKVPILSDEFNQTNGIDDAKWDDLHPNWDGRPPSRYKRENTTVSGGHLRLKSTLLRNPSTVNDPLSDIWVNAASCVSKNNTARHGYYYEANIKASSLSMTSAFWFRVGKFSEIDIIEHIGNPSRESRQEDLPFEYNTNTHYYGVHQGLSPKKNVWTMPVRGRDGFHTYGMWWKNPNLLIFYWDGREVMRTVPRVPFDENLKMIFDTEVFPFAQAGVPNIGLPKVANLNDNSKNTMLVNWVRVWELKDDDTNTGGNNNQAFHIQNRATSDFIRPQIDNQNGIVAQAPSAWRGAWTQWTMEETNNDYFHLKNNQTGKYLKPASSADNATMLQTNIKGTNTQWKKVTATDGYFYLENRATAKYFRPIGTDNLAASTGNDYGLQQVSTNLRWHFTQWKFVNVGGSKVIGAENITPAKSFKFYPNPASEVITVETSNVDFNVSIFDVSGTLMKNATVYSNSVEEIPISDLNAGVYLLRYKEGTEEGKIVVKKLIVK